MTDRRHEIGECGSHGDFETCQLGISTPATMPGCLVKLNNFGLKIHFTEKNTNFSIL